MRFFARGIWAPLAALALVMTACGFGAQATPGPGQARYPDPGISDTEIKIGGSFPSTGPFAVVQALFRGMNAYFDDVNANGGVNGRRITLTVYDDGADPAKMLDNVRRLNEQDQVFAFTGFGAINLGIRDYTNRSKLPQVFVDAGNSALGDVQQYPYTRAWWPDITYEGAIATRLILDKDPGARIGLILLNNDLGPSEVNGVKQVLGAARANQLVASVTYDQAKPDVSSQLLQLKQASATAIISQLAGPAEISGYRYLPQLSDWKPMVFGYSATASIATILKPAGFQNVKGLYSALYLKDPSDPRWASDAGVQRFKDAIARYGQGADPNDLTAINGYAAAQAFVQALKSMKQPTRAALLKAIDSLKGLALDTLYPGVTLNAGPGGRLIFQYQVVQFDGSQWQPIGGVLDAVKLGYAR